jgi:hypothetical protein
MTGVMKLVVPILAEAWSGQLLAAGLPFYELTRWTVPFGEIGVGVALMLGLFARLAGLIVIGIMVVATYVHLVVDDPQRAHCSGRCDGDDCVRGLAGRRGLEPRFEGN